MVKSLFIKILLLVSIVFLFYSPQLSLAQSPTDDTSPSIADTFFQKQDAIKNNTGLESWIDEAMGSNMMSLFVGLNGTIPADIFDVGSSQTSLYIPGGAIGNLNKFVASLNTPPASGVEYIAHVTNNFLGKPVYAQGVGFQGLRSLIPLWRGFRNIVYVLATIIFLAIGLMIMLRIKINPQAVITIQSAVPKVFTTLILVTFSYAIAGLVIDLCNVLQSIVIALLFSTKGIRLDDNLFDFQALGGSDINIFKHLGNLFAKGVQELFGTQPFRFKKLSDMGMDTFQSLTFRIIPGWGSMVALGGILGSMVLGFLAGGIGYGILGETGRWIASKGGQIVGGIGGGLIGGISLPLILSILTAFWLIKLYFGMLNAYVILLFKIILAPLEIAIGAFPNSKMGFSSWLMDVVAHAAVFPIVTLYIILLNFIVDAVKGFGFSTPLWGPSVISVGFLNSTLLGAAVALAGLALLAKLPGMIPEFIFKIQPSPYGKAIGEGLGQIAVPFQKGGQIAKNAALKEIGKGGAGYGIFGRIGGAIDAHTQAGVSESLAEGVQQATK
jgi:hypothetical protein